MDVVPLRPEDTSQTSPPARGAHAEPAATPPHKMRLVRQEEPLSGSDLSSRWDSLNTEGTENFLAGHFITAQSSFEAALELARTLPPDDLRLATSLNNLGEIDRTLGRFERAQSLLEEALAQRELVLGERHPHVARSRNNLGFLCESRAQYFEAFGHYRDAYLAMSRPPAGYPAELNATLMHLARLAAVCGAHAQARRLHEIACGVMGICINAEDPEAGLQMYISGQIHEMGQHYTDTWHCYRSALRVLEGALGSGHYLLAPVLGGMGRTLRARGHSDAAERLLHRALVILESTFEPPHHEIAGVLNSLAELYRATGRGGLAELLYRRALKMVESTLGDAHPDVAAVLHNLGSLCQERGEYDLAAGLLVRVAQIDIAVQLVPTEAFERLNTSTIGR